MEIINLGAGDGLPTVEWTAVTEKLDAGSAPAPDAHNARTTWLTTVNEDGSQHVTAVGAVWLDGAYWFQTGTGTRKHHNVERDPRCSVAVSIRDADVVVEGDAARVTDPGELANVAKAWADGGWPAEPDQSGRHHLAVQRTVARPAAVARLSHPATLGNGRGHRAGRPDSLPGLRQWRPLRRSRCVNDHMRRHCLALRGTVILTFGPGVPTRRASARCPQVPIRGTHNVHADRREPVNRPHAPNGAYAPQ